MRSLNHTELEIVTHLTAAGIIYNALPDQAPEQTDKINQGIRMAIEAMLDRAGITNLPQQQRKET